jgi:hypothetical protein
VLCEDFPFMPFLFRGKLGAGTRRQPGPREDDSVFDRWLSEEEEVPSRQNYRQWIESGPSVAPQFGCV